MTIIKQSGKHSIGITDTNRIYVTVPGRREPVFPTLRGHTLCGVPKQVELPATVSGDLTRILRRQIECRMHQTRIGDDARSVEEAFEEWTNYSPA